MKITAQVAREDTSAWLDVSPPRYVRFVVLNPTPVIVKPQPFDHLWVGALTVLLVSVVVALVFCRVARAGA